MTNLYLFSDNNELVSTDKNVLSIFYFKSYADVQYPYKIYILLLEY